MARSARHPLTRERNLILGLLLALAAASWYVLIRSTAMVDGGMSGLTMGLSPALFLAIWVVMMVAMMFPTAAPMILTFARVHASRRNKGQSFVPTWVFVAAYLLIWTLFGGLAYAAALTGQELAGHSAWLRDNAARIGGGAIALAGAYQLSPLKKICLTKCRSPLDFLLGSWRQGYVGAFQMGLQHGAYCLGCCWLLFVILFPLGVMNIAAMALITALIFAEKSLPFGHRISQTAALALVVYGGLVMWMPRTLSTLAHSAGRM